MGGCLIIMHSVKNVLYRYLHEHTRSWGSVMLYAGSCCKYGKLYFWSVTFLCPVCFDHPDFLFILNNQSINQSIGMNRMRWFLAVLRSLFHSSLSYTFSCHFSLPTILPSSLTSSSHLFLGLPLGLIVSRFIYSTLLGILFSSILCTCPNQRSLCSLIVSVTVNHPVYVD